MSIEQVVKLFSKEANQRTLFVPVPSATKNEVTKTAICELVKRKRR